MKYSIHLGLARLFGQVGVGLPTRTILTGVATLTTQLSCRLDLGKVAEVIFEMNDLFMVNMGLNCSQMSVLLCNLPSPQPRALGTIQGGGRLISTYDTFGKPHIIQLLGLSNIPFNVGVLR